MKQNKEDFLTGVGAVDAEQLDAENMDKELNEVEGGLANVG